MNNRIGLFLSLAVLGMVGISVACNSAASTAAVGRLKIGLHATDKDVFEIKQTIEGYWKLSREDNADRLDFLTYYPKSLGEECVSEVDPTSLEQPIRKPKSTTKPGTGEDYTTTRLSSDPDIFRAFFPDIRDKQDWSVVTVKQVHYAGNEAVADVRFGPYEDMYVFLTKEDGDRWRMFSACPFSVYQGNKELKRFGLKRPCKAESVRES